MNSELTQKNIEAANYFNQEIRAGLTKKYGKELIISADSQAWRERMLLGFAILSLDEYKELAQRINSNASFSSVAFHARNLLELMIWVSHCMSDEKNLRSLYEDAGKDGRELFDVFEKFMGAQISTSMKLQVQEAKNKLQQSAKNKGIATITGRYQSVSEVAALYPELSHYYKISNKILSKCAHPTALTIVGVPDAGMAQLRQSFYTLGCLWFCVAIRPIAINLGINLADPLGQELESILK